MRRFVSGFSSSEGQISISGFLVMAQVERTQEDPEVWKVILNDRDEGTRRAVAEEPDLINAIRRATQELLQVAQERLSAQDYAEVVADSWVRSWGSLEGSETHFSQEDPDA